MRKYGSIHRLNKHNNINGSESIQPEVDGDTNLCLKDTSLWLECMLCFPEKQKNIDLKVGGFNLFSISTSGGVYLQCTSIFAKWRHLILAMIDNNQEI